MIDDINFDIKTMKTFLLRIEDDLYSQVKDKSFDLNTSINNYLIGLIEKDLSLLVTPQEELRESILAEITQKLFPQFKELILTKVDEKLSSFQPDLSINLDNLLLPDNQTDIKPDIVDDIKDDIEPDIIDDIVNDIESDIVPDIESDIVPDIESDIIPDIESDIIPDIESDIILQHRYLAPGELANRLGLHKNALTAKFKRLTPSDFADYTKSLDPENKAWYRVYNRYTCDLIVKNLVV